jgi:solute carrier family 35 protein E1
MPHSTIEKSPLRASSVSRASVKLPPEMRAPLEKFPDHVDQFSAQNGFRDPPAIAFNSKSSISTPSTERWLPRKENASPWKAANGRSHGRQKSLGDAIRTIRTRGASVSENAREVADALKAPVSPKLIVCSPNLCPCSLLMLVDFMRRMVPLLRPHEHLFQIHLECVP